MPLPAGYLGRLLLSIPSFDDRGVVAIPADLAGRRADPVVCNRGGIVEGLSAHKLPLPTGLYLFEATVFLIACICD
jgi:hypothetical protein